MKTITAQGLKQLTTIVASSRIRVAEPLSKHTYIKIGGPAEVLVEITTTEELSRVYSLALANSWPVFILGGGSNVIVSDKGISGLVIKNRADKLRIVNFKGVYTKGQVAASKVVLEAESGVVTNQLVRFSIDQGLVGLEYFLGIPGTVGGAIYNNSHYRQQLIGNFVSQVNVLDATTGVKKLMSHAEMNFGYDTSVLQQTKDLVLSARFLLSTGEKQATWEKATAFAKQRASSQPLSLPNSGCIFKNLPEEVVKKKALPNASAGYLIDLAGLKGVKVGQIMISEKHANFMVNLGGGKAQDVVDLVNLVIKKIKSKYGVTLEPEVFYVGD